jgi:hypothetical protein
MGAGRVGYGAELKQTVRKRVFRCYRCYRRYQLALDSDCALGDPAIRLRKTVARHCVPNVADVSDRNGFEPAFQAWSAAIKSENATMLRTRRRL